MKKRVLVVVDMQNDFVNGSLGTSEAQAIISRVVRKIDEYKSSQEYVVYTMDTHDQNYPDTQEGKNLPVSHCIYGTEGWQLAAEISQALAGTISLPDSGTEFKKETFGSWKLAEMIKNSQQSIESIELVGLCTGICVITNAVLIKTAVPETPIIVDARCCACVSPESHKNALETMKLLQIKVEGESL